MKNLWILISVLIISSCTQEVSPDYTLDFSKFSFPPVNDSLLDIRDFEAEKIADNYRLETNKKVYAPGETVDLLLENIGTDTIFLYPNETEGAKNHENLYMSSSSPDEINSILLSQNPAFRGSISHDKDGLLIFLHFAALNAKTCEKLNLDKYDHPILPGEKIEFKVKMPNRVGYYQFALLRYTSNGLGFNWGVNKFLISNSFKISLVD